MTMKEVSKSRSSKFQATLSDRLVGVFSPRAEFERIRYRGATTMLTGGYKAADKTRRSTKKWGVRSGSADADTIPYLDDLRARSRDLIRNAPLAAGAINTVVTNTVGTGLMPQSTPDKDFLLQNGVSEEVIEAFHTAAEFIFWFWASNVHCDLSRSQNFKDMQSLVLRSSMESGDCFTVHRMKSRAGRRYKTALQIIEADRVENPKGQMTDTARLTCGVQRGSDGDAEGYYFLKEHPGHARVVKGRYETDFIPAYYSTGDWQVLHHFIKLRPEQTRGVPYLAPVIEIFKQLDRYTEAEIDAAVVSAMFTVFVKTENGEGIGNLAEGDSKGALNDGEIRLGNAAIIDLMQGEEIDIANPGRPNQAFDPFVLAILRQIGVALEIPFELLVKHFTASYSAAQAAIVEAWKFFKARRSWLADTFCQPVYEAVIMEAVALGDIHAPGFFTNPMMRAAWLGTEWIGPPRGVIDMRKEVEAYKEMEDRQWKTSAEITAELTGGDWIHKAQVRAKEEAFRRDNGLKTETTLEGADANGVQENTDGESDDRPEKN